MSKKRSHRRKQSAEVNLGFQIAPMIDVVFVILLFFIVQASDIQVENAHVTKLPGTIESSTATNLPDEIAVRIEDDGQIYLNDDPVDGVSDGQQAIPTPELLGNLMQLKQASDASKSELLVTVYANDLAKYQRVMDVMDALGQARIGNVSFQAGGPE